jgi:hypothetical protein
MPDRKPLALSSFVHARTNATTSDEHCVFVVSHASMSK